MAYLLVSGARIGQLVYPGAKRYAFTDDKECSCSNGIGILNGRKNHGEQ